MLPIRFCYQRRNPEICNTNNQDNEKNHYYHEIFEGKGIFFIVLLTASSACVGNQGTHNSQTLRPEIVQMSIGEQRNMMLLQ